LDTKQEAALAYDRAARKCGEERPLNYERIEAGDGAAEEAQAKYTPTHNLFSGPPPPKPRPAPGYCGVYAIGKRWKAHIYIYIYISAMAARRATSAPSTPSWRPHSPSYDRAARECGEEKPLSYDSIKAAEEA
jgi:hypothetical protein